jgi:hypothetical protein
MNIVGSYPVRPATIYSSVASRHWRIYVDYIYQWRGSTAKYMGWVKVKPKAPYIHLHRLSTDKYNLNYIDTSQTGKWSTIFCSAWHLFHQQRLFFSLSQDLNTEVIGRLYLKNDVPTHIVIRRKLNCLRLLLLLVVASTELNRRAVGCATRLFSESFMVRSAPWRCRW